MRRGKKGRGGESGRKEVIMRRGSGVEDGEKGKEGRTKRRRGIKGEGGGIVSLTVG